MLSHPQAEVMSPTDSEDRTPGRLQAVWPPPKPRDEEEKVGLKYTEAGKRRRPLRSHDAHIPVICHQFCDTEQFIGGGEYLISGTVTGSKTSFKST